MVIAHQGMGLRISGQLALTLAILLAAYSLEAQQTRSADTTATGLDLSQPALSEPFPTGSSEQQHYLAYPRLRQADVFWEKRTWVELNVCSMGDAPSQSAKAGHANQADQSGQEMHMDQNHHTTHMPRTSLAPLLTEAVFAGKLRAFSPGQGESLFGSLWSEYGAASATSIDTCRLLIVEDWLIDENSFEQRPRIIALGLLAPLPDRSSSYSAESFDTLETSDPQKTASDPKPARDLLNRPESAEATPLPFSHNLSDPQPLAWIPFDEARPLLAATQAIPPQKGRDGLSWDGVFLLRRFDGRVLKVSNVLDAPGVFMDSDQDLLKGPVTR